MIYLLSFVSDCLINERVVVSYYYLHMFNNILHHYEYHLEIAEIINHKTSAAKNRLSIMFSRSTAWLT